MSKNPTLSGEEISALMHELRDQEPRGGRAPGTARPFAFGTEAARPMSALSALDRMNERMVRRTAMRRAGEPQDVANAIAFLCSDLASYITGVGLNVSGGIELFTF